MFMDKRSIFCEDEDISAAAGTQLVGDQYDTGGHGNFLDNEEGWLIVQVTADFTSGGAATVEFILASDAAAAIATNGTASVHWRSGAIAIATLVEGYRFAIKIPLGTYERYVGILATTAVATTTAGSITAFMTKDAPNWKAYAEAVS
jgi:hypothetical protein